MSDLAGKIQHIVQQYGPWSAHNIDLGGGNYTMGPRITPDEFKLRRITQIIQDQVGEDWRGLRILDLACLEGLYGLECAMRGAEVVAIEGRQQHIEKVRFAADALGLKNIQVHQDDVRNLSVARYGTFDVILCLGILYHINESALFPFIESMYACCTNTLIIDTHVALRPRKTTQYKGVYYSGLDYYEYSPRLDAERKKGAIWASLDNPDSFWPTARSLYNALGQAGFTSAYECQNPAETQKPRDRITILAKKGTKTRLRINNQLNDKPVEQWPEQINKEIHPYQYRHRVIIRRLVDLIPQGAKDSLKSLLGQDRQ